jgi:hypothetical protein
VREHPEISRVKCESIGKFPALSARASVNPTL